MSRRSCCGRCGNRRYCDWGKNPPSPIRKGICVYVPMTEHLMSSKKRARLIRERIEKARSGKGRSLIVYCCTGCIYFRPI